MDSPEPASAPEVVDLRSSRPGRRVVSRPWVGGVGLTRRFAVVHPIRTTRAVRLRALLAAYEASGVPTGRVGDDGSIDLRERTPLAIALAPYQVSQVPPAPAGRLPVAT